MSIDFKLDLITHDILIDDYDMVLTDDIQQCRQNLKIRLLFFLGEWFLDITRGVPYFEEILIKNPNQARVESILKQQILNTDNVKEMLEFSLSYNSATRRLGVVFSVNTDFGILEISEGLAT